MTQLFLNRPLLGTNPIAIAIPTLEEPPIVLDMAPTVVAHGKVLLKAQRGEQMPIGWMIDREGKPLTDPNLAENGHLLPIGDYKGYGLSLIIGILAGALNRAAPGRYISRELKDVPAGERADRHASAPRKVRIMETTPHSSSLSC
jgi:LDH2 family malate/lactate/ureidoglycolate dehydrogenase